MPVIPLVAISSLSLQGGEFPARQSWSRQRWNFESNVAAGAKAAQAFCFYSLSLEAELDLFPEWAQSVIPFSNSIG
jgi:hypothetical protein